MSQPNWTKEQKQAIDLRRGTLLLAAAAGSGKTAVLVQRVIDILTDPSDPVDPRQLLVVTFTNAAAAQMNQRISQRFQELLSADPANAYLRKQMAALSAAQISTVHSYCISLIRSNFQLLGIQPDIRLGDEGDMQLLMADLLEDCIEDCYRHDAEQGSRDFARVVKLFSVGGSDKALPDMIRHLYNFLRSRPFYHDWLDSALAAYDSSTMIEESLWGKLILDYSKSTLSEIKGELLEEAAEADLLYCEELESILAKNNWDEAFRYVQNNLSAKLKNEDLKLFQKQLGEKLFCCNSAAFAEDLQQLQPILATLFQLVKDFDRLYTEEKQRRHLMDFSDLEHYAIQLLVEKLPDGTVKKSPLAGQLSAELRYVLVDEYQDTNQTQNLIFQSLSQEDNLFMVGDIKQSIYRFRQADPTIFLSHKRDFHLYDGEHFPATLYLSNNFRSRREVTDSVNWVFSHIMRQDTAEMDYSEGERLIPSATYPDSGSCITEYLKIKTKAKRLDGSEAAAQEAFALAERIHQLLNSGFLVTEKGEQRPLEAGDICILLRSHKKHGELFQQALAQKGISSTCESKQNYLDTLEVSTALSLLHSIENPLQDIHLTAALMSVAFRFSADDMARVRIHNRDRALYLNCLDLAREGDEKCRAFVEKLQDYRLRASAAPTWQLLQELLWDSGLMAFVSALENGQQRQANLRLLVDHARSCEDWGYTGVGGFLRYLDRIREREQEMKAAPALQPDSSAVHILSIHKSKGLEFPVVFLCEAARDFNTMDTSRNMIYHPDYGFACIAGNGEKETTYTSVPLEALRLATHNQLIAEEMRLLYVAMTRAKEKLIISAMVKEDEKKKEVTLPNSFQIRQASSYADWLDMALRFAEAEEQPQPLFDVITVEEQKQEEEQPSSAFRRLAAPDPAARQYLAEVLSIPYSDPAARHIPSKLTVTDIAKGQRDGEALFSKEPSFLKESSITAAQRGTVMHNFLSCADHQAGQQDLEGEIRRMVAARYFTEAEARSLDRRAIRAYYSSELFARIGRSPWVKREFPFLMDMGREELGELFPELGSHRVTVQGIADLIFEEDSAIILVDYKTDHLEEEEIMAKYRPQLLLYQMILNRLLGKPVKEMLIYSMYHKKTLKIQ